MGGYGSGGHNRKYKGTTEDAKRLDIVKLKRNGIFEKRRPLTLTWSTRGMVHMSLTLKHLDGGLLVGDATAKGSVYSDPLEQYLPLTEQPRKVGGKRTLFECPDCAAHRQHLYLKGDRFVCMSCAGLTYKARRERAGARAFRRWDRISARLGGAGWSELGLQKPKNMHWRTFDELQERLWAEEQFVEGLVMASLQPSFCSVGKNSTSR